MGKKNFVKLLTTFVVLGCLAYVWNAHSSSFNIANIQQWVDGHGTLGPVFFIGLYALATVLLLPGLILTLAGGLLFGAWLGTFYNIVGVVIGSTLSFIFARYIAEEWVATKVSGPLKILKESAEEEGWKFIAVVRLVPAIPFNIANYALGLTKVSLLTYIVGSGIFMLPGCFVYTYIGSLGEDVIAGDTTRLATRGFFALGILIALMCIPWLMKRIKSKR